MKKNIMMFILGCLLVICQTTHFTYATQTQKVPMLKELKQVGANQLEITYDIAADPNAATKVSNYWIQSNTDIKPRGIATLGKNDKVSANNALTPDKVKITPVGNDGTKYLLTFKENIPTGESYKLIICYVIAPNGMPYNGDNGSADFIGR